MLEEQARSIFRIPWKWRQWVPLKYSYLSMEWYCIKSQKTNFCTGDFHTCNLVGPWVVVAKRSVISWASISWFHTINKAVEHKNKWTWFLSLLFWTHVDTKVQSSVPKLWLFMTLVVDLRFSASNFLVSDIEEGEESFKIWFKYTKKGRTFQKRCVCSCWLSETRWCWPMCYQPTWHQLQLWIGHKHEL
jgi:hypothetical protein